MIFFLPISAYACAFETRERSRATDITIKRNHPTFSTFEYETQRLVEAGAQWWGLVNIVTSVAVGYAAVQLGVWLAR